MDRRIFSVGLALLGLVVTEGQAQDEAQDSVKFTVDAGFAHTSGNSDVTSISGGQTFRYMTGSWILSQSFDALFNRTGDSTTAENYQGKVRGDRALGQDGRLALFLALRASKDRFAGINRRFEEALGVSYDVVKTPKNVVMVEAGATMVQQQSTAGVNNDYPAALTGASYLHYFTPEATFTVTGEYIPNLENDDDYRLNGEAKLLAPLSGAISLSVSYLVRYDNQPEPGFKSTDRFFISGIQLAL